MDKRDREANALFNIINSLGSIYLTYFEALKKLNDQFSFSRTNPALSKAFGFFGDMEKCVSYADRAMNDNLKYDGLCNPINQLLFDSVTTFIETVTSIDINGKIKPLKGPVRILSPPPDLEINPSATRIATIAATTPIILPGRPPKKSLIPPLTVRTASKPFTIKETASTTP